MSFTRRNMLRLSLTGFLTVLLLSGPVMAAGTEGSVIVTIPSGSYEIVNSGEGHEIVMEDFGRYLVPGQPNIPAKIFSIAIPPGAAITGVTFQALESVALPGRYSIAPARLPRVIGDENSAVFAREERRRDANYTAIYGSDSAYPEAAGQFVRPAGYRKYNLADVRVFPFTYHPVTGTLVYHAGVNVTVHYNIPEVMPAGTVTNDNLARTEKLAEEMIVNYHEAASWYPQSLNVIPVGSGLYEYVIITLESLSSTVQILADWEAGKGRTTNIVTTTWIDNNYSGYDLGEKIRNFLRDKYSSDEWGIVDVCLVGDYDDVPMRRCAQDVGYGEPETDYYYAELSLPDNQSWDADGDHRWGEDSDPIDFTAEVNVGRIPWSDLSTVEHICNKTVAFENNSDPSFKKNILLLGAYFWADTDNAVLMEYKTDTDLHPWMTDWTETKMYEQGHSVYPSDYDITNSNVRSVWSAGTYSFVNWAGHGSPTACYRMYGSGGYFISSSDCQILNDDYPAIIFADACSNSDTDELNIGKAMLKKGAIGFLGSTKVAFGCGAWNDPMDGSSQSMDYFFTTHCTSGEYTQGEAQQHSLRQMYINGLWYYTKYEMFEWGALWGSPGLSMGTLPVLTITFPDGLPEDRMPPGPETTIYLEIRDGQETYVPDTGKLSYRMDPGDPYTETIVTPLGGHYYSVVLPAAEPGDQPEFYFSAEGNLGTTIYSPFNAPETVYSVEICLIEELMHDDFEVGSGWTVEDINVQSGTWERCVPNTTSGEQVAPTEDNPAGEGTYCFVTENGPPGGSYSDYDIDGGPTHLISPTIDLSSGDAQISAYNWYYSRDGNDPYKIDVSNDNGSTWTNVYSTNSSLNGWSRISFDVSDHVTPTSQVKVRYSAQDQPNDDIVEAGVDDFSVESVNHSPNVWCEAYSFSAGSGCNIDIYLDAGPAYAGRNYILGGSFSGARPGTPLPGGEVLPLNRDVLTDLILANLNGVVFQNFSGTLDGDGRAVATLNIPGAINPSHAGKTVTFAFLLTGGFDFVSNPVFVEIEP